MKQMLMFTLPVFVIGGCTQQFSNSSSNTPAPMFKNGDVVRCKAYKNDMIGIISQCDYLYVPSLKTYYCAVDFYPSSVTQKNFSRFNNCQRMYIYEYELIRENRQTAQKILKNQIPTRWDWMYRD